MRFTRLSTQTTDFLCSEFSLCFIRIHVLLFTAAYRTRRYPTDTLGAADGIRCICTVHGICSSLCGIGGYMLNVHWGARFIRKINWDCFSVSSTNVDRHTSVSIRVLISNTHRSVTWLSLLSRVLSTMQYGWPHANVLFTKIWRNGCAVRWYAVQKKNGPSVRYRIECRIKKSKNNYSLKWFSRHLALAKATTTTTKVWPLNVRRGTHLAFLFRLCVAISLA